MVPGLAFDNLCFSDQVDGLVDFYEQHVPLKARVSDTNIAIGRKSVTIAKTTKPILQIVAP